MNQTANRKEPAWIRDIAAIGRDVQIAFMFDDDAKIAQLTADERYFCEYCGTGFPLWPISEWAEHVIEVHADNLTLQTRQGIVMLSAAGLTDQTQQFLSIQMIQRVSMRRRAHELGMLVLVDARGNRIDKDDPRAVRLLQ